MIQITRALSAPDVRERLATEGAEPKPSTPQEFRTYIQAQISKLAPVVRQSGATSGQ